MHTHHQFTSDTFSGPLGQRFARPNDGTYSVEPDGHVDVAFLHRTSIFDEMHIADANLDVTGSHIPFDTDTFVDVFDTTLPLLSYEGISGSNVSDLNGRSLSDSRTEDTDTFRSGSDGAFVDVPNTPSPASGENRTIIHVEALFSDPGEDAAVGSVADNLRDTRNDADLVQGQAGNDTLIGGDGDDVLIGGTGENLLTGGRGADLFIFTTPNATDTITDFEQDLDALNFATLASMSGVFLVSLNGSDRSRINCFSPTEYEILSLSFVQSGDTLEIYLNAGPDRPMSEEPLVSLAGLTEAELTWDDFIF